MIFLETTRLLLRKFQEADFPDFCEYAIDEEMCRMMGRDNIIDAPSARPTFDWLKDKEAQGYALVLKETGKVIGNLTIAPIPNYLRTQPELKEKNGRTLSFSISRHYQRRGLMYEAVSTVIQYLFREDNVDFIHCGHFSFNTASGELQKKLGFTHLRTDTIQIDGEQVVGIENILWRD